MGLKAVEEALLIGKFGPQRSCCHQASCLKHWIAAVCHRYRWTALQFETSAKVTPASRLGHLNQLQALTFELSLCCMKCGSE